MVASDRKQAKRPHLAPLERRWHLARDAHQVEVAEFKYATMRMHAAFQRWNEAAMLAAGGEPLTFTEVNMLHVIRMQDRPKSISAIANLLNRDDIPNLQYGLRKLRSLGLIRPTGTTHRKNFEYEVTPRGREVTDRFAEVAEELVYSATRTFTDIERRLIEATDLLRLMTGVLDEAARAAGTYMTAGTRTFRPGKGARRRQ